MRSPEHEGPANRVVLHCLKNKFSGTHCKMLTLWQEKHSQRCGNRCKEPRPAVEAEPAIRTRDRELARTQRDCKDPQLLHCGLLLDRHIRLTRSLDCSLS